MVSCVDSLVSTNEFVLKCSEHIHEATMPLVLFESFWSTLSKFPFGDHTHYETLIEAIW